MERNLTPIELLKSFWSVDDFNFSIYERVAIYRKDKTIELIIDDISVIQKLSCGIYFFNHETDRIISWARDFVSGYPHWIQKLFINLSIETIEYRSSKTINPITRNPNYLFIKRELQATDWKANEIEKDPGPLFEKLEGEQVGKYLQAMALMRGVSYNEDDQLRMFLQENHQYIDFIKAEVQNHSRLKTRVNNEPSFTIIGLFCMLVNKSKLIERNNRESAEQFCRRVCEAYNLPYSDNVRQRLNNSDDSRNRQLVIDIILPSLNEGQALKIKEYIAAKYNDVNILYG